MKRIFVIFACAAMLLACGEKKANAEKQETAKEQTECNDKKKCGKQDCDKKQCSDEQECNKQECNTQCNDKQCSDKQECNTQCNDKQPAGCIHLDTEGFAAKVADLSQPEWKYLGDKPAVVDFYADWCGPCKAISPLLEELAKEYDGKLYIYKINVDNDPEIASAFNIEAIPTLLFIPMEGAAYKNVGGLSKEDLEKMIAEQCF